MRCKGIQLFSSLISLLYRLDSTEENNTRFFLGGGEEFVYSPVGISATLHDAVNNTGLEWEVDGFAFESPTRRSQLHSRGILKAELTTSMDGITTSIV